jgi:hypothetical protein
LFGAMEFDGGKIRRFRSPHGLGLIDARLLAWVYRITFIQ